MSYKILTDSSCNLSEAAIDKMGLEVVSLNYILDGVEKPSYVKGQVFDHAAFYKKLSEKVPASTSQVTPQQARDAIRPLLDDGHDVLYIGFSSGLSGTYSAVCLAMEELKDEFPSRTLLAEDTLSASAGMVMLLKHAVKMRDEGKSMQDVQQWIADNKLSVCYFFTADDLWYLQRGGRLSKSKALMGTILSIKPIITLSNEGKLVSYSKAKGRKKAMEFLLDKMDEDANREMAARHGIYIIYAGNDADAQFLAKHAKSRIKGVPVELVHLEPVIGCHTGPGIVAIVYMGAKREM